MLKLHTSMKMDIVIVDAYSAILPKYCVYGPRLHLIQKYQLVKPLANEELFLGPFLGYCEGFCAVSRGWCFSSLYLSFVFYLNPTLEPFIDLLIFTYIYIQTHKGMVILGIPQLLQWSFGGEIFEFLTTKNPKT